MALFDVKYERLHLDRYFTPAWPTEALLPHLGRGKLKIWEPCCGDGGIARVLHAAGHSVVSSDIEPINVERIPGGAVRADFFEWTPQNLSEIDAIISNPPYGKAAPLFVRRALELMRKNRGMVAMLLPMAWDTASTRRDLFADCPAFMKKLVLTRRIVWFNKGEDAKTPKENHCWLIWDFTHRGAPTVAYGPEVSRKTDDFEPVNSLGLEHVEREMVLAL